MKTSAVKSFLIKTVTLFVAHFSLLHAQDHFAVYATNTESAKPAAYIFEVTFASELSANHQIKIVFPNAFNVNPVMMAVSEKLGGSLKTTVEKNSLTLHQNKADLAIAAGDTVDLQIASIINPAFIDQEWEFTFILSKDQVEIEKKMLLSRVVQLKK
ncbi:hypothetical protein EH223_18120 [candidate division KSB1 bacterium]|nr:hypothetical protein [candidate division KSB1 bacterium]RQW00661.1 MAG: hypothetical protein EH223_18120 [candidate division KSB1 bacterium]